MTTMKKLLLIMIFVSALGFSNAQQANHWTTITGTQYNLTMSGVISIDDVAQTSTMLEIGAFCGDECRGSARAQFFPPTGDYVVSLTVVSNQQSGETITFRLYDHGTQQEFPTESVNSITFNANANFGEMGNWYPFAFVEGANEYEITVLANPLAGGTVTGGGTYSQGDVCTLTATVNDAYTFVNWTKDGVEVSSSTTYSFTVTETASYTANFIVASAANHWATITGTQYNLTMSGVISIDDVAQTSTALEIGAFCGGECRGSARAQFFPPTGDYVVSLTVVSNELSGETIVFRLFDHRIQQEYPNECVNSITFNANANFGEMGNWYPFAFYEQSAIILDQTITLAQGWNWWAPTIQSSKDDLLAALQGNLVKIMSDEGELVNGTDALVPGQMYRIQTSAQCDFTLSGIRPASVTVTIENDYNWFGYTGNAPATIATVFGTAFGPATGDKIIAQDEGFAIYDGNAWSGTLTQLQPGHGYVYFSTASGTKTVVFE